MVEPVSLTIGALVAAVVVKAAEKAGETAVEEGPKALVRLVGWLRERFSHSDNEGQAALALVESDPGSPVRRQILAEVIDQRAAADAAFRTGLEQLVGQAKAEGADMKSVSQIAEGIGIVQIANAENSTITVSQGPPSPPAPARPGSSPGAGPTGA